MYIIIRDNSLRIWKFEVVHIQNFWKYVEIQLIKLLAPISVYLNTTP